ncbi:unnamed protein product [Nyctereutes procyonoides]|uniref:(raccoon dog) hypothetical protein n=1 Tax=Nyctereutes procyonoides TaxID=34880 RepID=A0A811Y8Q7_NYCPR|nr:unnamed protein product [Nyctereutes procyonoides]
MAECLTLLVPLMSLAAWFLSCYL